MSDLAGAKRRPWNHSPTHYSSLSSSEEIAAMFKCPFCQYANEDGALFCEQCKSDLGILEAAPPLPTVEESTAFISTLTGTAPIAEATPFGELARPVPVATPVGSRQAPAVEPVPVAGAVTPPRPV